MAWFHPILTFKLALSSYNYRLVAAVGLGLPGPYGLGNNMRLWQGKALDSEVQYIIC